MKCCTSEVAATIWAHLVRIEKEGGGVHSTGASQRLGETGEGLGETGEDKFQSATFPEKLCETKSQSLRGNSPEVSADICALPHLDFAAFH